MYAVVFHAHQKIDRVSYRHLRRLVGVTPGFPRMSRILHFEGHNGPDGTKFKYKEGVEAPWHFINPFDAKDTELRDVITSHYAQLVEAIRESNQTRAAFEAAWLAHALVDGLTPAHHFPYEETLEDLRGENRTSRKSMIGYITVKGESGLQSVARSLKLIGPKGLLTTHTAFEAGVFSIMMPMTIRHGYPTKDDLAAAKELGIPKYFQRTAQEIAALNLYERFYKTGWTPALARSVRRELVPRMVLMVTLAWYSALVDAKSIKEV
jgi:hypothetical protein